MIREVYLKIDGRVQGIGFRRWAVNEAQRIGGISGWVRNEDDGSVEILMRGEEDNINKMIKSCYQGPMFARVDKISFLPKITNYFLPAITEGRFIRI
jgi:acylphosphatase